MNKKLNFIVARICLSLTTGSHANPDSQLCVRKMFSTSFVPQPMENHTSNFFFKNSIILASYTDGSWACHAIFLPHLGCVTNPMTICYRRLQSCMLWEKKHSRLPQESRLKGYKKSLFLYASLFCGYPTTCWRTFCQFLCKVDNARYTIQGDQQVSAVDLLHGVHLRLKAKN